MNTNLTSRKVLDTIYQYFIRPLLEYGGVVWHGCTMSNLIEQYECSMTVVGAIRVSYSSLLTELGLENHPTAATFRLLFDSIKSFKVILDRIYLI